jgi:hypothetical protein
MKLARCVDCHFLYAINGVTLPEQQREQLRSRNTDSFTWLFCSEGIIQITHIQPHVFDQVLREWKCKGYLPFGASLTFTQMVIREAQRMPKWYKIAVLITILLGLAAAIGAILQAIR